MVVRFKRRRAIEHEEEKREGKERKEKSKR
jgi:hypothetical protein